MNRQGPGKIDWTDWSINPIKGLCPVGCWYCYANAMAHRFKRHPSPRLDVEVFQKLRNKTAPLRVFICSTFELFHSVVPGRWRDEIFKRIEWRPDLTFQILTKMPERIDRPMPDNAWLGVTVTKSEDLWRIDVLRGKEAGIRFVSFEPLFEDEEHRGEGAAYPGVRWGPLDLRVIDWVIIGRMTGHGRKHDPSLTTVEWVVENARNAGAAVHLKGNLRDIWRGPLIQGFPRTEARGERR